MSNEGNGSVNESMQTLFENLEKFLTTKTVVGEPIKINDVTIIPVTSVSFGIGSGGDADQSKQKKGLGGGGGAKITPVAVLVVKADGEVELLTMKRIGGLDKLIEMVPDIIEKTKTEKTEEKKV